MIKGLSTAMRRSFQSHQLDYDWRFDFSSRSLLAEKATGFSRVVLLGCPSLMEELGSRIKQGLLLERNPNHLPTNGFAVNHCDLRFPETVPFTSDKFDLGIVDAPWYPNDLLTWLNIALSLIDVGGSVLFVLWPENIRQTASFEHQKIWSALKQVGELKQVATVSYDTPLFEKVSIQEARLPMGLRTGLLFRLRKERSVTLLNAPLERANGYWRRLGLADTQIGIKVEAPSVADTNCFVFEAKPFVLRSTSRTDPALASINIWTSKNVVAQLSNPLALANGLALGLQPHIDFLRRFFKIKFDSKNDVQGETWQHRI